MRQALLEVEETLVVTVGDQILIQVMNALASELYTKIYRQIMANIFAIRI